MEKIVKTESYSHLLVGKGKVTLAAKFFDSNWVEVGVAFCSPKDQFNRKKGRLIATGRREIAMTGTALSFCFTRNENVGVNEEIRRSFSNWIATSGVLQGSRIP